MKDELKKKLSGKNLKSGFVKTANLFSDAWWQAVPVH